MKKQTQLQETQIVLLNLLKSRLFGYPFSAEGEVDWNEVFKESYMQGVHMMVFSDCRELEIPLEIIERIKPIIKKQVMRDIRITAAHEALHRIMTEANLPYCIIKGVASADYYKDPTHRSLGDVDFLIDIKDQARVLEVMNEKGYSVDEVEESHHIVLEGKDARMELHVEPPGMPNGEQYSYAKECMSSVLEKAGTVKNQTVTCKCPSEFHHGLIILMHTMHHMLGEGVGLRHICDWAVFLEHMGDRFEEVFEKPLRKLGLWKFASVLSLMTVRYLGVTPRGWMTVSNENEFIAHEMILDVFSSGNFGYKDGDRRYEGLFISDRGKSGVKGNRFKEGFRSLNRITYKKWPISKRIPVLLPVGWIVVLVGFIRRNNERKRQGGGINVQDVYQNSLHRRNLYESLQIYVSEDVSES